MAMNIRRTENVLNRCCVINVNNQDGLCRVIKLQGGEEFELDKDIYKDVHESLSYRRFNWSVYIAGFGFDGSKYYTKSRLVLPDKPYLQADLVESLTDEHKKLLESFNPSQLCGFGWVASPTCHDFSEKQAYKLFEHHGAFNEEKAVA